MLIDSTLSDTLMHTTHFFLFFSCLCTLVYTIKYENIIWIASFNPEGKNLNKKMRGIVFSNVLIYFLLCNLAFAKECVNLFPNKTELASSSMRAKLSSINDEAWTKEMLSSYQLGSPANEGPEASKFQAAEEKFENKMLRNTNATGDFKLPGDFLKEVSLHDVSLLPNSMHWRAQQTNLEYLVMLDVDRLVWSFRKTAGLPTPGTPYGGWEDQKMELRGHFLGICSASNSFLILFKKR